VHALEQHPACAMNVSDLRLCTRQMDHWRFYIQLSDPTDRPSPHIMPDPRHGSIQNDLPRYQGFAVSVGL